MSLSKQIYKFVHEQVPGEALLVSDIIDYHLPDVYTETEERKLRQNAYVILNRLVQKEETFKRYDTGIYYRTSEDILQINQSSLITRLFIENYKGEKFGYYTHDLCLRLHGGEVGPPEQREVVSNFWRRQIDTSILGIKVVAPMVELTSNNIQMLQLLDVLRCDSTITQNQHVRQSIVNYILKHDIGLAELMALAVTHTNKKVVYSLALLSLDYVVEKKKEQIHGVSSGTKTIV